METRTDSDNSKTIITDKLCTSTVISLLLGICFFLIYFVLECVIGAGRDLKGLLALISMLASMMLIYLIAPLLSFIAIANIFCNWRAIVYLDNGEKNKDLIRKIAYRYLIVSILFIFSTVSLLPVILEIFVGSGRVRNLPALLSFWLLIMALLALAMGFISYKLFVKTSGRVIYRFAAVLIILTDFVGVVSIFLTSDFGYYITQRFKYSNKTETYSGSSELLERTVIVPTLDCPCPKNKNVIWCSSFQLAWNRMKDDIIGVAPDSPGVGSPAWA